MDAQEREAADITLEYYAANAETFVGLLGEGCESHAAKSMWG